MLIDFYEIYNCSYSIIDNNPVLIAPGNITVELLYKYRFVQLNNGQWYHYLTQDEYNFIMNNEHNPNVHNVNGNLVFGSINQQNDVSSEERNLSLAAIITFIAHAISNLLYSLLAVISYDTIYNEIYSTALPSVVTGIGYLITIASLVFIIMLRIKYPNNKIGLVLMILIIIKILVIIVGIIFVITAFRSLAID